MQVLQTSLGWGHFALSGGKGDNSSLPSLCHLLAHVFCLKVVLNSVKGGILKAGVLPWGYISQCLIGTNL